jgi:aspartate/methionine/tyrosine aminotransferase
MGQKYESFDVYDYRGEKLRSKLESYLLKGNINSIIYSNPNNPAWICLTEEELQIIGDLANKYDVVVIEDLAYFAMDFRKDLSRPGQPPYQATVAKYTGNYVLMISSSKVFSYAGQRIAAMIISDQLFHRHFPYLEERLKVHGFGNAIIHRVLYSMTSGTSHSGQYALAAMFKAANEGIFNFVEDIKEYGEKAKVMKRLFQENGFKIVYENDPGQPIGDGFYFTVGYPGMSGAELLNNLLYYGISAISLSNTGSDREGLRACVSHVSRDQFDDLEKRLKRFAQDFQVN